MLQPVQNKIILAFWVLALLDLLGIAAGIEILHYTVKPLLIPVLILLLLKTRSTVPGKNLLMTGLFFSWMGDVFLLFENKQPLFFIFGLASFLITHIFYIIYFLRIRSANASLLKKQLLFIVLVPAYGIMLVWLLFPHLGDLKLPVMVYAAVICTMLLCSLHIFLKVNKKAAFIYVLGAAAFVGSDSLLAINKFYEPIAYAGIFIMLTYCAAQYFIVRGYIQQNNQ
ncbi:MAG: lysoplasmalogenase [Chitinophagaceae bacterium]|nr:lysoplasmalogenase [Chitinophagaceae bacterium]